MKEKEFKRENESNNINKDNTTRTIRTGDGISEFTSISNLQVLPNKKIKICFIISIIFNILVWIGAITLSFIWEKKYILNVSYINDPNMLSKNDIISVFNMNVYMYYILIFGILLFEILKLIFIFNHSQAKKIVKFIFIEMGYWFVVIKLLFGFNILISFVHLQEFNFVFITSLALYFIIIGKL